MERKNTNINLQMIVDIKQNLRANLFWKNITLTNKKMTKIKNQNEEHTYIYIQKIEIILEILRNKKIKIKNKKYKYQNKNQI